jgi:hypothetical protein
MHAVPLNNVTYDPAGTIKFKLGNAIVAGDKVFSINGSYAPHVPGVLTWTDGRDGTGYWPDFSNRDFITDDNGNVWTYSFGAYYENNNAYGTFAATQIVINSDGTMQLADSWSTGDPPAGLTHEAKAKITISASEYIYYNSMGYCIVKKDSSGNGVYFSYGVFSSPVNNLSPYSEKAVFISDYLYWLSGTSICRIRLADGASESAIYTDSKILSTVSNGSALSLSGDNLVFYAYADATTVNTYSIPVAGPYTPVLLSTSSAGVKDIVELEF